MSSALLHKCNMHWQAMNWGSCVDWLSGQFSSHSLATTAKKLMFTSTVYCIWQERNARIFLSVCTPTNMVVRKVESLVRCRLLSVNNFKENGDNDWFMDSWHLPHTVLRAHAL